MHVVIVHPEQWNGGSDRCTVALIRHFVQQGHRVTWLTTMIDEYWKNHTFDGVGEFSVKITYAECKCFQKSVKLASSSIQEIGGPRMLPSDGTWFSVTLTQMLPSLIIPPGSQNINFSCNLPLFQLCSDDQVAVSRMQDSVLLSFPTTVGDTVSLFLVQMVRETHWNRRGRAVRAHRSDLCEQSLHSRTVLQSDAKH